MCVCAWMIWWTFVVCTHHRPKPIEQWDKQNKWSALYTLVVQFRWQEDLAWNVKLELSYGVVGMNSEHSVGYQWTWLAAIGFSNKQVCPNRWNCVEKFGACQTGFLDWFLKYCPMYLAFHKLAEIARTGFASHFKKKTSLGHKDVASWKVRVTISGQVQCKTCWPDLETWGAISFLFNHEYF